MEVNPYEPPVSVPSQSRAKRLERIKVAWGLCIVVGLLISVARSLWLADWVLCGGIAITVIGLWGAAVVAGQRERMAQNGDEP
jgi:hypothetical protein